MRWVVKVLVGAGTLDARRVAAHDVVVAAGDEAAACVPLHLTRAGVQHRRREDGQQRVRAVQRALGDHRLVLPDAHWQRYVVVLYPAACATQKEKKI